jgi:large subunit ribosomal protein L4
MPLLDVFDIKNNRVSQVNLREDIFSADIKEQLIKEVVHMQLANRRKGTASTKTRGEVSGGGRKPWRQKGTGRARAGSIRSPLWKGGGVVFGPHPKDYSYIIPKKARKVALRSVLSLKVKENKLKILDNIELPHIKTKEFVGIIKNIGISKALIVIDGRNEVIEKSARNIPDIKVLRVEGLNVYDILRYEDLVITKSALERIEERLS